MKPAPFDFVAATSISEAVSLLAAVNGTEGPGGARLLAGGQSLMPQLAMRTARPTLVVDINGVGQDHVSVAPGGGALRLGALVRQRHLERDPVVAAACPLLAEAAGLVGHPAIRNRGTLGGSVANGDPRAELPTSVLALGGSVVAEGPHGRRTLSMPELFAGAFATTLRSDEVLVEVVVPQAVPGDGSAFCEWTPRTRDFAVAGVAAVVHTVNDVVTSVGAAACGFGAAPIDLGDALAELLGAGQLADALLRHIAASVEATCLAAGPVEGDGAELAGLLATRAIWRAVERANAAIGVAA